MTGGNARVGGVFYTHRVLWGHLQSLIQLSAKPQEGTTGVLVAALLLTYFCLEGYTNYLGSLLCPDDWRREQDLRGTLGKYRHLCEHLGVCCEDDQRPVATYIDLRQRRHALVHPRTYEVNTIVQYTSPTEIQPVEFPYESIVDSGILTRAVEDVEAGCDALQRKASRTVQRKGDFSPRAFVGISSTHFGSLQGE